MVEQTNTKANNDKERNTKKAQENDLQKCKKIHFIEYDHYRVYRNTKFQHIQSHTSTPTPIHIGSQTGIAQEMLFLFNRILLSTVS